MFSMDFIICISPTCPNCISTLQSLEEMNVNITIRNIETSGNFLCPSPIIPALYRGHNLIAYGNDIVKYFND